MLNYRYCLRSVCVLTYFQMRPAIIESGKGEPVLFSRRERQLKDLVPTEREKMERLVSLLNGEDGARLLKRSNGDVRLPYADHRVMLKLRRHPVLMDPGGSRSGAAGRRSVSKQAGQEKPPVRDRVFYSKLQRSLREYVDSWLAVRPNAYLWALTNPTLWKALQRAL